MNAASGAHDDYFAALAMANFGLMHCARSPGPQWEVSWSPPPAASCKSFKTKSPQRTAGGADLHKISLGRCRKPSQLLAKNALYVHVDVVAREDCRGKRCFIPKLGKLLHAPFASLL